ncbi:uncharacterized protein [Drosophila kikkawai]|uniref:Uncharacterized protein n=1 Tax=Drosophila kikkawai TaxID=30033 RepID=A0ABM3C7N4_DROKI
MGLSFVLQFIRFKMGRSVSQIYQLLIVLQFICYSTEVEYEFLMEDGTFYNECKDLPGALSMEDFLDMTNLNRTLVEEGIQVSGNMTSVWYGVDYSDRIQMTGSVQYFDRGTWVPTILNMLVSDLCKVLYDDKQLWYKSWSSHIVNRREIEKECLMPGTVFIFETYTANFRFGSGIYLKPGRYSIRLQYKAFDKFNIMRPNDICYEIRGEFFKI